MARMRRIMITATAIPPDGTPLPSESLSEALAEGAAGAVDDELPRTEDGVDAAVVEGSAEVDVDG